MLVDGLPRATWGWADAARWRFDIDGAQHQLAEWLGPVLEALSDLALPREVSWAAPSGGGERAVVVEFDRGEDLATVVDLAMARRPADADLFDVDFDLLVLGLEGDLVPVRRGLRLVMEPWGDGDAPDHLEGVLFFQLDVLAPSAGLWENTELASLNSTRLADALGALAGLAGSSGGSKKMLDRGYPQEDFAAKKEQLLREWRSPSGSTAPSFRLGQLLRLRLSDAEIAGVFSGFAAGDQLEDRYRRFVEAATGTFRVVSDEQLLSEAARYVLGLRSVGERLSISAWSEIPDVTPRLVDRSQNEGVDSDLVRVGIAELLSAAHHKTFDSLTDSYVREVVYLCSGLPPWSRRPLEAFLLGPLLGLDGELDPLLEMWRAGASLFIDANGESQLVREWQ